MLNPKAFAIVIVKTGLAFLPIIFAPFALQESSVLINFYRLQLGYSIVAAIVTLGLGSYIYLLSSDLGQSFKHRRELWFLTSLFRLVSTALFFCLLVAALLFWNNFYLEMALLTPISYFLIQQQIYIAKKQYKDLLFAYLIPSVIFLLILIFSFFLGVENYTEVCVGILFLSNLLFFSRYQFILIITLTKSKSLRINFFRHVKAVFQQISNSIITSVCAPLSSLFIIDWVSTYEASIQVIAAYYFYARVVEALVGFCITYLLASGLKSSLFEFNKCRANLLCILGFLALITFCIINVSVYFLFNFMSPQMAAMEFITGTFRLILAIMSIIFLKKTPNIIGFKEGYMCLAIWLLSNFVYPHSILYIQFLILIVVFSAFLLFSASIYFLKFRGTFS